MFFMKVCGWLLGFKHQRHAFVNRGRLCVVGTLTKRAGSISVFTARLRPSGYDAAAFATKGLAEPKLAKPAKKAGGARRDRTADLLHAMQALSQLSYGPLTANLVASSFSDHTIRALWAVRGPKP